ncbi:ATP-dependent Clp protease ATP-binding subunit [Saccharibacillus sp. CPCC 101409]|uniref:ATP-dependent Clp protease ATP-binding subunit n=1 Tax=Saccharibacillus sp. CPCC 101409 TaxID=3058041 RepID=UPI002671668E|nr:ATP-dependent Clp protease ATP-binding subunit [Saccharibacillus sp. CPCC 101409]MDO3408908.1 ATP-dependent Clp protease ATP-binding subunit [Saccharibacillus sp. CPCC 101409]
MRCQHCNHNQATVGLSLTFNNKSEKVFLCEDCYAKLSSGVPFTAGFGPSGGQSSFEEMFKSFMQSSGQQPNSGAGRSPEQAAQGGRRRGGGMLDQLARNLNDEARGGRIDQVIGREDEIERVIEILNRRNKNNPVLIGEPGVGKTAIAEGLALRIVEGNVPAKLLGKEVYSLDVASLVAGTGIRGQFEEKVKQLIVELQQRKNALLFIDEIHLLVGAGSAEGSMDAGNILKPVLARGELQVIGATTLKEYRQIEKDAALERRFQPVTVDEPTAAEAIEILKGLRPKYEEFHGVTYSDDTLEACVRLSGRYIQDRFLPDKAIDLLDEAGAKLNLRASVGGGDEVRGRLEQIKAEKDEAARQEDYERAAGLRDEEAVLLQRLDSEPSGQEVLAVSVEDIQNLIERKTGIPVGKLQADERGRMKNLAERLEHRVIGQSEAVDKVSKAVRRGRAGLRSNTKPIASFLFVGPTGVGKTELSKALAEELFGSADSMIRLDMSEYMEKHSVSKLIGSPPGYVGHEEAGQLTEKVRRNPYSIILLDEIEKAHPDVQHMFLQVLDDGRLTDSQGRTVSFKDTVIIMTSNAGTAAEKKITMGFTAKTEETRSILNSLGNYFRPEFLNRFDGIVPFASLKEEDLVAIVDNMLAEIENTLSERGISLAIDDEAKRKLAELGYDPSFGARPLRRMIQQHVEDGITDLLLDDEDVNDILVDVREDAIRVAQARNSNLNS